MLPIELQIKDLENIENAIKTITQVSVSLAFASLAIWVWVQAPGLDFALPLSGGSVSNINVGYAVIFGPFLVCFFFNLAVFVKKKVNFIGESLGLR